MPLTQVTPKIKTESKDKFGPAYRPYVERFFSIVERKLIAGLRGSGIPASIVSFVQTERVSGRTEYLIVLPKNIAAFKAFLKSNGVEIELMNERPPLVDELVASSPKRTKEAEPSVNYFSDYLRTSNSAFQLAVYSFERELAELRAARRIAMDQ